MPRAIDVIRLALCITELEVGGAERRLVELATGIDHTRFAPVVYSLGPRPQPDHDALVQSLETAGIEVHFLGGSGMLHFPAVLRKLTKLLRAQQPQVLQTFLFHANLVGRTAARRAGVPHVVAGIRVAERQAGWHLTLDRWTSGMVNRYVCVSRSVAEFSRTTGRLPPDKLLVIPNGVALPDAALAPADLTQFGLPPGRRAIITVGRLDRQKRVDWLLHAASKFLPGLPDHDLLIVGRGPEEPQLRQVVNKLSLGRRVHFAGWQEDVTAILRASDLFVLPSAWEGMPNAMLEAMASGLPVVATDVEGVAEILGPLAGQQAVSGVDLAGFAQRVRTIASDGQLCKNLGSANRERVAKEFTIQGSIKAYERLYQEITSGRVV